MGSSGYHCRWHAIGAGFVTNRQVARCPVPTRTSPTPTPSRDTPENQKAYPQNTTQQPGIGFPIARIAAFFSLATGAVIELGICRYAGKGQGEVTLLRQLWNVLCPGDVLLTDRLMANWTNIFLIQQRGFELVTRLNKANRKADFRRGKRLGKYDHRELEEAIFHPFAGSRNLPITAGVYHDPRVSDSCCATWVSHEVDCHRDDIT